jgi:hypothetical protein
MTFFLDIFIFIPSSIRPMSNPAQASSGDAASKVISTFGHSNGSNTASQDLERFGRSLDHSTTSILSPFRHPMDSAGLVLDYYYDSPWILPSHIYSGSLRNECQHTIQMTLNTTGIYLPRTGQKVCFLNPSITPLILRSFAAQMPIVG